MLQPKLDTKTSQRDDSVGGRQSFSRAWSEVQRFLLEGDWIDSFSQSERDYGYLYGFLRKYPLLAAERFGGYQGGATPFHLMQKELQKKAPARFSHRSQGAFGRHRRSLSIVSTGN